MALRGHNRGPGRGGYHDSQFTIHDSRFYHDLLSCWFFYFASFSIYLFFHTQHNIISKIQQNKTTDTYSTSQGPIKREGEREGQQEHKSHSFIQSRMSNKKHCQASMVEGLAPPTRAVVHSHDTICRRLRIQYVFLHMCGVN